jgi:hypothetical protein
MEDKWLFLKKGEECNLKVTPCLKVKEIVCKDRNEEGGMGIAFFKNAEHGGDWIIQERFENSEFLSNLLPSNPPLSTLRVITSSRHGGLHVDGKGIEALSCVFRAGRQNASTDHSSILFDVDPKTGTIGLGTTNAHWYILGPQGLRSQWVSSHDIPKHPDNGVNVSGVVIPNIENILKVCTDAHLGMMPDVPMAGWDVALTTKGPMLLEANLSCNFFRGSFNEKKYFDFVHEYFLFLDTPQSANWGVSAEERGR